MRKVKLNQVLGEYNPTSFFTKTNFSLEEIKLGNPNSEEYYYVYPTILHEWVHHLQIIGTRFGRAYSYYINTIGVLYTLVIKEILNNESRNKLFRPFSKYILRSDLDFGSNLLLAIDFEILKDLFLGLRKDYVNLPNHIKSPVNDVSPIICLNNKEYSIGAYFIMESQAYANELIYYIYQSPLSEKIKKKAIYESSKFEPYEILLDFIRIEFNQPSYNFELTSLICDIALNGEFEYNSLTDKIKWEDLHPGWRFIRIVEYLKGKHDYINSINELSAYKDLYAEIYLNFKWNDPAKESILGDNITDYFLDDINNIRKTNPIALSIPMHAFNEVVKVLPISFYRYRPATYSGNDIFYDLEIDNETKFEAFCQSSVIFETTIYDILYNEDILCPWHGTSFSLNPKCNEDCLFLEFFKTLFSIDISEFLKIPII